MKSSGYAEPVNPWFLFYLCLKPVKYFPSVLRTLQAFEFINIELDRWDMASHRSLRKVELLAHTAR